MNRGWPLIELGDVMTQYREYIEEPEQRIYQKLSVRLYGKGVVLDTPADGSTLLMRKHQIAKRGQVILSEIWGKKGAIGFVPPEGHGALVTSHFFLFDLNRERVESRYLQAVFTANYLQSQLDAAAKGTTGYAAIRPGHLLAARIPLPPLDEQRRIVARIEELAAKIEEARGLRRLAVEHADSLLHAVLDEVYISLQRATGTRRLDEACVAITDGDHVTPRFVDAGVAFIFVGNASSGRLHFKGCKYVTPEYFAAIKPHRKPSRGDILFTAVGATLGVPVLVDTDQAFCFQRHIAILKPDRRRLLPAYLWFMLGSGIVYRMAWAATTGSAQPTVPLRAIKALSIPLPSLVKQQRIVSAMEGLRNKLDELKRLQAETARELGTLLLSVLDKAFNGEL